MGARSSVSGGLMLQYSGEQVYYKEGKMTTIA